VARNDSDFLIVDRGAPTLIAVDHVINAEYDGSPLYVEIGAKKRTMAMPDGTTGTITHTTADPEMYFWWDGTAGDVSHIEASATVFGEWYLEEAFSGLSIPAGDWFNGYYSDSRDEFYQLPLTGRFFFRFDADVADSTDYTIDFSREDETPRSLLSGSDFSDSTITADGMDWFRVSANDWLRYTGGASATAGITGDLELWIFGNTIRLDPECWDTCGIPLVDLDGINEALVHGFTVPEYMGGGPDAYLVRVVDLDDNGGNYDLAATTVGYTDLGEVTVPGQIFTRQDVDIAADETQYFMGRAPGLAWSAATLVLSNFTSVLTVVDVDTVGSPWNTFVPTDGQLLISTLINDYFFFTVSSDAASTFDLSVTAATP
jgi:hypothetical protein